MREISWKVDPEVGLSEGAKFSINLKRVSAHEHESKIDLQTEI